MTDDNRPLIAVTMGDPGGVGPEVTLRAIARFRLNETMRPLLIGPLYAIERTMARIKVPLKPVVLGGDGLCDINSSRFAPGTVSICDTMADGEPEVEFGEISAAAGRQAIANIRLALALNSSGKVKAVVGGPLRKRSLLMADCRTTGHVELIAELSGCDDFTTLLVANGLHVALLTTHIELIEACQLVKKDLVLQRLRLIDRSAARLFKQRPRIGVAALNPHGGDRGRLGRIEADEIQPAVAQARSEGIFATGPISADSVFKLAIEGEFDAVLAMYHDQGHIAATVNAPTAGVTVGLGLPFVYTSTMRGTTYDAAGEPLTDGRNLQEAMRVALLLATGQSPLETRHRETPLEEA